jgi:hypothetical protein
MTERIANCTCRLLQLLCKGEPRRVSICHCFECQRRTGSLFGVGSFFERDAVSIHQGVTKAFTRNSITGKPVTLHFCPDCGSTVFWYPERMPDLVGVAVGAFADPSFRQPEQSVWTRDKHAWLNLPDDMRNFAVMPPPRGPIGKAP